VNVVTACKKGFQIRSGDTLLPSEGNAIPAAKMMLQFQEIAWTRQRTSHIRFRWRVRSLRLAENLTDFEQFTRLL
jgi:hypothetical protein